MFTLLPEEYKKKIVTDYRVRLFSIALVLLSGSLFIGVSALIPSYALVNNEQEKLLVIKQTLEKEISERNNKELSKTLKDITSDISFLNYTEVLPSTLLSVLLEKKTNAIKIFDITFTRNTQNSGVLLVSGSALSRKDLTAFKKALETVPFIESVHLPIENLAKESNLPFSIKIDFNVTINEAKK